MAGVWRRLRTDPRARWEASPARIIAARIIAARIIASRIIASGPALAGARTTPATILRSE